jgi:hypothetical protein
MTATDIKKLLLFTGGILLVNVAWNKWIVKSSTGGFIQMKPGFGFDDIIHAAAMSAGGFVTLKFAG